MASNVLEQVIPRFLLFVVQSYHRGGFDPDLNAKNLSANHPTRHIGKVGF